MLPFRTPALLPWLYPQLTWKIETQKKEIFLTFDDGPVPGPTEFVLETLQQFQAVATFFCIGDNVRKHPEIFQKIIVQGHAVGNHTFHHLKGWRTSNDQYLKNIHRCDEQMNQELRSEKILFRPPYGQITRSQIKMLTQYRIIMWDVLTQDYSKSLSEERCLRGSIRATRPGSIIVFHDSWKAERNLKYVLPRYLQYFQEQGYAFQKINSPTV